jgi:DNA topoisomerase-1
VNTYLRHASEQDLTAKDFRTWGGTVVATNALEELGMFESETQGKKNVVEAIKMTAKQLGNTPTICRKCYIHPGLIDSYLDESLLNFFKQYEKQTKKRSIEGLRPDEARVLAFLEQLVTK